MLAWRKFSFALLNYGNSFTVISRTLFSKPIKKFYKNVSIAQTTLPNEDYPRYEIHLDSRKLKTPSGKLFTVPNEMLALAVAHEWDSQQGTIKRYCMHLSNLCIRVLDLQPDFEPRQIVQGMMQYAESDTICFRCREPDELAQMQATLWDPILNWIADRYAVRPPVTHGLVANTTLSEAERDIMVRHLSSYDNWGLIGLQACVTNLKSIFLTMAMADGFCSSERAVELSQLEQLFQIHRWGEVSSYHDVESAELNARVSAALFLILASQYRRNVKTKLGAERFKRMSHLGSPDG
ncbi:unnamed protein product [Calicophoron daubneyi]|uniref:ATP synthase mitochondrial F1 complex assembly factor 2 n=1 Tax=Calicophoron daubneyi TaxID=300641 RepID=A0AAV2TE99_CALDB